MKTLLLVSLILSMMVYIGLKFFSAPSPSWGMAFYLSIVIASLQNNLTYKQLLSFFGLSAFKSRSQTFRTNVIFAYIIKTD